MALDPLWPPTRTSKGFILKTVISSDDSNILEEANENTY